MKKMSSLVPLFLILSFLSIHTVSAEEAPPKEEPAEETKPADETPAEPAE